MVVTTLISSSVSGLIRKQPNTERLLRTCTYVDRAPIRAEACPGRRGTMLPGA